MHVKIFLVLITALNFNWTHAQISTDATTNDAATQDVEMQKITVTGSYIKRAISKTAPTPVVRYDATRMEQTSSFSVADMLKESPVFNDVSDGEISMHGQTEADNLVLLNGLRLPKPAGGEAVNIDFIPAAAVENVEVLKDGASALYGSEALAGVVNISTKKDFTGSNIYVRHATPQIRAQQESDVVLSHGQSFGKARLLVVGQFKKKAPLEYKDTIYGLSSLAEAGSLESDPGNINDINDEYHRAADCPQSQIDAEGRCRTDRTRLSQFGPQGAQRDSYNLFLNAGYDVSAKSKLEFVGIYNQRKAVILDAPYPIQFKDETDSGGPDNSIPPATLNGWNLIESATGNPSPPFTDNGDLMYLAVEELGRSRSERVSNNYVAQTRYSSQIRTWDWEISAGYGNSVIRDKNVSGNANKQALRNLITTNQWNPFKPKGGKDVAAVASTALQTWFQHSSDIINTKLVFTGELFKIRGKPLLMAFGNEEQWQSFKFDNDPASLAGIPLSGTSSNQRGSRRVDSAFLELNHSPTDQFEVQLAGRFDNYTDVGSTLNPKVGLAYHFSPQFTSRLSYGTGFKAPDLLSVFKGTSVDYNNFRDEVICAQNGESDPNCDDGVYRVNSFGNKNLKPEQAEHYNAGIVISPNDNFTTTLDYWMVKGREGLSEIDLEEMTKAEQQFGASFLNDLGIQIQRDPVTRIIQNVLHPEKVNSGIFIIKGIDFSTEYRRQIHLWGLGATSLRLQMDHTHILGSGSQTFSFRPYERTVYLDWKNILAATFAKNNHLVRLAGRTFSGYDKDVSLAGVGKGTTPVFTEYDIHYQYFASWEGTLTLGIKNVFNRLPVRDYRGFIEPATTNSNYLGRLFYLSYSHDF